MKRLAIPIIILLAAIPIFSQEDSTSADSSARWGLSLSYERSMVPKFNESLFGVGLKVQFKTVSFSYNLFGGSNTTFSDPVFKTSFGMYEAFHILGAASDARDVGDTSGMEFYYAAALVLIVIPQTISVNIRLNDNIGLELYADLFPIEISRNKTSSYLGFAVGMDIELNKGTVIAPFFGLKSYITENTTGIYFGIRMDLLGSGKEKK